MLPRGRHRLLGSTFPWNNAALTPSRPWRMEEDTPFRTTLPPWENETKNHAYNGRYMRCASLNINIFSGVRASLKPLPLKMSYYPEWSVVG